jgi:UDP-2,3-diacylglucosamine hydrolase
LLLFISDLHLQADRPALTEAFLRFVDERARSSRQLYLLGDLFEYWAGDDDLDDPFHHRIVAALRALADDGVEVFWIAGNRDFLVGATFASVAGLTLLPDPWVLDNHGRRIVLVHGDAQCTDDVNYMAFRAQVRQPAWQQQFLAMPLAQRKQIIAGLRENSRKDQGDKSYEIMDVTPRAIADVFAASGATVMIHGHTHRPALHEYAAGQHAGLDGRLRYVLPDWEPEATPPRGGWIAIADDGTISRHALDGSLL